MYRDVLHVTREKEFVGMKGKGAVRKCDLENDREDDGTI
jgi:hypothetical protein